MEKDNCPNCGVSLLGNEIPKESQHLYGCTHLRREIGIDGGMMGIYDGIVAYKCPDCGHYFPRSEDPWALDLFDKFMNPEKRDPNFDPFGF